ncbi:hypothetical protein [Thiohalophilus sp.]|uniref:hypothetical protein n=1 Tax=Thiohalophilus sp. TaxID=3028392 RepID=UPI002ACE4133|nr:hypothetical protein [Thiohalophilus sp.]MDZ7804631.1 hypothetical protein [Thiohalophilus sp.]
MTQAQPTYLQAFRGSFTSMLRWPQLDALWQTLREQDKAWYIYAVGEPPPEQPVDREQLDTFITEIDKLLRQEHDEDYCGIVYVDEPGDPAFIKIYDPNNLGVSCGFSTNPPLPGWVLSLIKPVDLQTELPLPGNRRRWWQKLFKARENAHN